MYSVRFSARELWAEDAPARIPLYIDLFDNYMTTTNKARIYAVSDLASLTGIPWMRRPVFRSPGRRSLCAGPEAARTGAFHLGRNGRIAQPGHCRSPRSRRTRISAIPITIHWLAALEGIAADKRLVTPEALTRRRDEVQEEHQRLHGHSH